MIITINKPIPKLNTLYRTNKFNHIYKSTKSKEFCDYIKQNYQQVHLFENNIIMKLDFYVNRDCDIDSMLKCLLDSFNEVIYKDDKQIYELNIKKHLVKSKNDVKTIVQINDLPND